MLICAMQVMCTIKPSFNSSQRCVPLFVLQLYELIDEDGDGFLTHGDALGFKSEVSNVLSPIIACWK